MSQEEQILVNLIQKHQNVSLTEQEKILLEDLIAKNEQYAEFFNISTQAALPLSNTEQAFEKVQKLIAAQNPIKETKIYKFQWWKYAAACSILLCAIFGLLKYQSTSTHKIVYEVPMGQSAHYTLADGSLVSLNGGSKLVVNEDFGAVDRQVTLQGEGFFDIKHDTNKPFIVTSKNLKIKVLGTAFNVRDYEDDDIKQTTLLRGKVELTYINSSNQSAYTLLPGDKITFSQKVESEQSIVQAEDIKVTRENIKEQKQLENNVAWKDGVLVFDNEPLPLVASKLEKWFNVSIELKDSSLQEKRFSGSFENLPLQKILSLIKETGGVKNIGVVDNTIIIE